MKGINRSKKSLLTYLLMLFFSPLGAENKNSSYSLGEGENDSERLAFQNDICREFLINAFIEASVIRDLKGLKVVDYGSGTSAAYQDILQYIGPSGCYVGIDSSQEQINLCKRQYPNLKYIHGNEKDQKVCREIKSADVILIRFVVMHQKEQKDFLQTIYNSMKPRAILIIQEPDNTEEQKIKMLEKYPYAEILCDFKTLLGKSLGLDFNFARKLKVTLEELNPTNLTYSTNYLRLSLKDAKTLFIGTMNSAYEKGLAKDFYNVEYKRDFINAVEKLPDSTQDFFDIDRIHTAILQK